jgi:hypothetical protein
LARERSLRGNVRGKDVAPARWVKKRESKEGEGRRERAEESTRGREIVGEERSRSRI